MKTLDVLVSMLRSVTAGEHIQELCIEAAAAVETYIEKTWRATHRHYKGGMYRVVGFDHLDKDGKALDRVCGGALLTDDAPIGTKVVIYDNETGEQYARAQTMFNDPGRFTRL